MPKAWSEKDERQYQHIRDAQLDGGVRPKRAEEIAARTVNKQRREEGRAIDPTPRGTGNPNTRLDERTKEELRHRAAQLHIAGRSSMTKAELVAAIRARG